MIYCTLPTDETLSQNHLSSPKSSVPGTITKTKARRPQGRATGAHHGSHRSCKGIQDIAQGERRLWQAAGQPQDTLPRARHCWPWVPTAQNSLSPNHCAYSASSWSHATSSQMLLGPHDHAIPSRCSDKAVVCVTACTSRRNSPSVGWWYLLVAHWEGRAGCKGSIILILKDHYTLYAHTSALSEEHLRGCPPPAAIIRTSPCSVIQLWVWSIPALYV